jgi:hypothetical protein
VPAIEQGNAARHNNRKHKNRNKLKRKQGILGERLMDLQLFNKSEYLLFNKEIVSNFALSVEKLFWSASTLAFNLLVNNWDAKIPNRLCLRTGASSKDLLSCTLV